MGMLGQFISMGCSKKYGMPICIEEDPLNYNYWEYHTMTNLVEYQYRILNIKAVIEITALSRSTIYEMINPNRTITMPIFPNQFI